MKINGDKTNMYKMEYAWFSQKQFEHMIEINKINKNDIDVMDNCEYPFIYYKLEDGNIVLISEITSTEKYNSNFDDVFYLGIVDKFYGAFKDELRWK